MKQQKEHMPFRNLFAKKITSQAIIIVILAACFYLYEFYVQIAPVVIQQELMRDLAIDATKLGLVSGCFYLSYTALQLPSGLLLDRYSTRTLLTCICALFAFSVLLFAHATNFYIAALARLIMGGASSCAFIAILHLAARWIPIIHFALFAGIAEMMGAVGGYAGTGGVALILQYFNWRTAFTGFAYAGFVLALLIGLIVRNQPATHKKTQKQRGKRSIRLDLKTIMYNKQTWAIGVYSFFIWAPILGFGFWGVEFIRLGYNLDKITAAQIVAFAWLGVIIAGPLIGWLSDFIGRRCIITTICALSGSIAMTIAIFVTSIPIPFLYLLMFLIGLASAGQTISFALIRDNNTPHTNSAANGLNNMLVVAGGFLFQPLIGKILDACWQGTIQNGINIYSLQSYQVAFLVLPICYFIATLISIFFIKETRCFAIWQK